MNTKKDWLFDFDRSSSGAVKEGIVSVEGYDRKGKPPEEVAIMEKALFYKAQAVFFEAPHDGKPPIAQAFIYRSEGPTQDSDFAHLHQRLWSWGGVPLVYRVTSGMVQLFRCAHRPDFEKDGQIICKPFKTLKLSAEVANDPWWDADRLRNGTLWDDPQVCKKLLSSNLAAQKTLINAVKRLYDDLNKKVILPKALRRKLLILSVLIAYLEERDVFEEGYFGRFKKGADKFFQVLADGPSLVALLAHLEDRFNGHVFVLSDEERETLTTSKQLPGFKKLIEAREESGGQLNLWNLYSFADLPVELISHIYQLFVQDSSVAVYTPQFLVRLMLGEVLSWERLDRLDQNNEVILDGACGSGIFLVEAFKRLVLHWRYRNDWKQPDTKTLKKLLTSRIRGVDLEPGAVELASFSLCLAVCDALQPMAIRASVKLFPELKEKFIHTGCFFETREQGKVKDKVGVIVGNPPFASKLTTDGAKRAYDRYQKDQGDLPDKQVAYLFLHESMEMLAPGGILSMLQQYNFLYNQQSLGFRRKFIERWDVREILDFISVRGLFQKGSADTKVIAVVAEAQSAPPKRQILHATFRRSGRADAEQGFDIDYYDMHWLPRELATSNDGVWRSDLLGGGRLLGLADRTRKLRSLKELILQSKWENGEGWIVGNTNDPRPAEHVIGKKYIRAENLNDTEVDQSKFSIVTTKTLQRPRRSEIYTPPLLLIHKHEDLGFGTWSKSFLTYPHTIFGISAAGSNADELKKAAEWLVTQKRQLQALLALRGTSSLASKATAVLSDDILELPFPEEWDLRMSRHEEILVADIVDYYRDLVRLGEDSAAMKESGESGLSAFNEIFTARINGVYTKNKLQALPAQVWPGVICQPYIFGKGKLEWNGADELKGKVDALLREKRGGGLNITRIARLYDGACIYLLKPDRLRYWLRSVALRDADETLADLAQQGF